MIRNKRVMSIVAILILSGVGLFFFAFFEMKKDAQFETNEPLESGEINTDVNYEKKITKKKDEIIPPTEPISFNGILSEDDGKLILMGWELKDIDASMKVLVGQEVHVSGFPDGNALSVTKVTTISEKVPSEEIVTVQSEVKKSGKGFAVDGYTLKSDVSLKGFEGAEVFVVGRKTDQKKVIEVLEIDETKVIEGVLTYEAGKEPDVHYSMGEYDVHSDKRLTELEGKSIKALVVTKTHGQYIDDKHVTLIEIK